MTLITSLYQRLYQYHLLGSKYIYDLSLSISFGYSFCLEIVAFTRCRHNLHCRLVHIATDCHFIQHQSKIFNDFLFHGRFSWFIRSNSKSFAVIQRLCAKTVSFMLDIVYNDNFYSHISSRNSK